MAEVTLEFLARQNERIIDELRHIRGVIDEMQIDMHEVKGRLTAIEALYASLSFRVDRLDQRLERVERRLDLAGGTRAGVSGSPRPLAPA